MKKFLAVALVAMFVGSQAYAQEAKLSQAEPTANTIRVGNRPGQGSFGLYMGLTTDMFKDMFEKGTSFKSLPLVNLKYMVTDRWEARLGLQFYKKSESISWKEDEGTEQEPDVQKYKSQWVTSTNRIYPGLAYHFSNSNILDVYAGAELLIGWHREKSQMDKNGDYFDGMGSMSAFQFGGGLFIGLQAFISDLPLAIGFEYGFHGYNNSGVKYKCATEDGDFYTADAETFKHLGTVVGKKDMGARTTQFGQQCRVTLSYYFNR